MRLTQVTCLVAALLVLLPVVTAAQGFPATVVVAETTRTMLAPTVTVPGTVVSRDDARISAEVEGQLTWVADVGTRVDEGAPIAQIDDTTLRFQQEEYKGLVARERARLKFLEPEVGRLRQLAAENNAAKSRLDQTESDLDVARSDLIVASARLKQVEDQLKRTVIRAPFAGIITQRLTNAGERVSVGDRVVRLVNPAAVEVVARAPLNSVAYIREGTSLELHNDFRSGEGIVRTIVPFGSPDSHMFEARLNVPAELWTVGESVRLSMPTAELREVLAVPRDALVLRREGTSVFRVNVETGDDGQQVSRAERVSVATGLGDGDLIEVSGDLSVGDIVVVRGAERLQPGQAVVVKDSPAGKANSPGLAGN